MTYEEEQLILKRIEKLEKHQKEQDEYIKYIDSRLIDTERELHPGNGQ